MFLSVTISFEPFSVASVGPETQDCDEASVRVHGPHQAVNCRKLNISVKISDCLELLRNHNYLAGTSRAREDS